MNIPTIIAGACHADARGKLLFNNSFDASAIRRIYIIANADTHLQRGWQGHRIEKRWFSAVAGRFRIKIIAIDDWETPSPQLPVTEYILDAAQLDILFVPEGHITCIQSLQDVSKLLVMADYRMGEVKDEYRFDIGYFLQEVI